MPPTTVYSFGDIVLVHFPFTDQSSVIRRLGRMADEDQDTLRQALAAIIG